MCNHCPFVKHIRSQLAQLARDYQAKGAAIVGINSNDVENYPDDAPDKMALEVKSAGYTFPYLYDKTQAVAKAYRAACTPDFFLFDKEKKLVYRGQLDNSRPGNDLPVTGADLRAALDAVLEDRAVPKEQKPSIGCNIKWKPGNEPDYFG
jgi:thiol-disulfide isomerase/thioredoxin